MTTTTTNQSEYLEPCDLLRFFGGMSSTGTDTEKFLNFVYPKLAAGSALTLELRALCGDGRWRSGSYSDFSKLVRAAKGLEQVYGTKATYFTLNPLLPGAIAGIGAKEPNKFASLKHWCRCAKNEDILNRSLYLIDVDPVRPTGVMATRDEHEESWVVSNRVHEYLTSLGWPEPVIVDSGSGYHLLYRGDRGAPTSLYWEHALEVLSKIFDTDGAHIDQSIHNAGRISRLPGFLNQKGEETATRRHRVAFVYSYPEKWVGTFKFQVQQISGIDS
jgi:hypothetical protein